MDQHVQYYKNGLANGCKQYCSRVVRRERKKKQLAAEREINRFSGKKSRYALLAAEAKED